VGDMVGAIYPMYNLRLLEIDTRNSLPPYNEYMLIKMKK
jgi:hypothetical protein